MKKGNQISATDEILHSTETESLEQRVMELALKSTDASNGAIFLWDGKAGGLVVHFHLVDGLMINLPGVVLHHRQDDRPNGIALWVYDHNQPYLCNDTSTDENYGRYFQNVLSVAAVPIQYQKRALGVISVSSRERNAFTPGHIEELQALAASSAKFLRRAQLSWSKGRGQGRPFLIKGLSREWFEVERQLEQVAQTNAPVLIQGESGTGKELVANAIHFNSTRTDGPFVTTNCAAIPDTLLESTLFGHVKGAFTGATFSKKGEFKKAHGGTLFLDEIGDLPLSLQAKLLRAAEDGEIQPLGSNMPPSQVDVRLLCATHHDLAAMVRKGLFRDDLYYRLSVVTMELPPLRSYKNNLDTLAQVFLLQAAKVHGKEVKRLSAEARALLQAYEFPGNVRELKNAIEHAVIMTTEEMVLPEHLPRSIRKQPGIKESAEPSEPDQRKTLRQMREAWLAPLERNYLIGLLEECGGNVKTVARLAGVDPVTVYRLMKKRGIETKRA
jgi:transcriptional regulator with GAF, ATPase, and Fis domain